jgi:hypothetical protein
MSRILERTVFAGGLGLASIAALRTTQGPKGVHVCVGADRVLRFEATENCPAGQSGYRLMEAGSVISVPPAGNPGGQATPSSLAELNARLDGIQQRLANFQAAIADQNRNIADKFRRVVAPFQVDDSAGKPIFLVKANPRGFQLLLPSGEPEAVGSALPGGGFFKVLSPSQDLQAVIGIDGKTALVTVRQGTTPRGMLSMGADGKPRLQINNPTGEAIAVLTQGSRGDGMLQLLNVAGLPRIEAGTDQTGVGLIRAGPQSACVGGGLAAPSCIKGHP